MSKSQSPYIFDEFFTSGLEESISPFLKKNSRHWGKNLSLKSSLLSAVFLIAAYGTHIILPNLSHLFLLFVYFLVGTPALINTIEDIKNLEINIDVLMTLAAFLSFLIGSQLEGGLLLVLFAFSGAMEHAVSKKAKGALLRLNQLAPTTAVVIDQSGATFEKSVQEIQTGTHLLVKAGEIVPLDGTVIDGHAFVNLVHLTGESVPVGKHVGDTIQAGSRNIDGTLTVKVTKTSAESTLSKIIKLIHQAQDMKPKLQRFLDTFSQWYAITIISLFFLFAASLPYLLSIPFLGNDGALYRALTFLIAASPCALIIATPTAYLSAISTCARQGILLKGGITLDALAHCKTMAFDKTGTLTTGELTCIGVEALSTDVTYSTDEALAVAASLEQHVTHPIGKAICTYAAEKEVPPLPLSNFKAIPGFGLQGTSSLGEVKIGNASFIDHSMHDIELDTLCTFLRINQTLFIFYFLDAIRPEATNILESLRKMDVSVAMLTGDHDQSAQAVAHTLGIQTVYSELRPKDKLETVSTLSQQKPLAMVGDGINDAPALARAQVGISMGKIGSATAIDASDIVLLQDDLSLIPWLYKKSLKTLQIVRENLILALGVIIVTTGPALLGHVPLWIAVILHEGGTVLVGLNSLRLLKK